MASYNELKEELQIKTDKKLSDGLAALTHFWQNTGNPAAENYRGKALEYLQEVNLPADILDNPDFIPEEYDVPFPPPQNPQFTFIDLFAGVGGFRLAFQNLGGHCVFSSEWNDYAKRTYDANFGEIPFGDITQINEADIPDHDILIAGFPCQPFSIAGVSKKNALGRAHGFRDETQGTLFFDVVRILDEKRPRAFLLENVKNLVSHDSKRTFQVIEGALREIGYSFDWNIVDGRHFVPQHRERTLMVGFNTRDYAELNDLLIERRNLNPERYTRDDQLFIFPELPEDTHAIEAILESDVSPKYTLSDKLWEYLQNYARKHREKGNGFGFGLTRPDGVARTLSARYYKDGSEILIPQERRNPRRLTPRECARLQGYPDNFVIAVSDTQAYKQFGNSVVSPLMEHIGAEIVDIILQV